MRTASRYLIADLCVSISHGYDLWLFERWEYLRLLYEQLPDREERIRTGKAIKSLQTLSDEVKVTFEDGSEDHGSIVVGADGIHSTVRRLLREASNDAFPNTGFSSSFMGIYGIGPLPKGVPSERLMEISNFGFWIHLFTQPGRVFWIVYKARDKPVHEFRRYSDAERDEFAKQFDDCPVGNGVTFGQVRQGRWREYLTDFEEGQLPEWHWDRVVLLGDAIHKAVCTELFLRTPSLLFNVSQHVLTVYQTPNLAFGAEMAMESGVQLVNVLKSLLKDNAHPDTQSIETAFKEYQDRREAPTKAFINATSDHLRLLAGTAAFSRFILRYLLPMIGTRWILDNQVAPLFAQSPKLDFVPMPRQLDYRVPYHDDVVMQPPSKASLASLWEWLWGSKPSADKTLRAESETQ